MWGRPCSGEQRRTSLRKRKEKKDVVRVPIKGLIFQFPYNVLLLVLSVSFDYDIYSVAQNLLFSSLLLPLIMTYIVK